MTGKIICGFLLFFYMTVTSGQDIIVKKINSDDLNTTVSNKDGCVCPINGTTLWCSCSSFQSALNCLENNSIVIIMTNSVTLRSKISLSHLHNISIVGTNSSTVECANTGCLQVHSSSNISIQNIIWNNCSCRYDPLPAGITIKHSSNLLFKNCIYQNSLSTAVYLENVCGTVNFDHMSIKSNKKRDVHSNATSTAGLEINNFLADCVSKGLNISITNSLFVNNQNIECLNCAFAGALQIYVHALSWVDVSISNTTFTDNVVESGLDAPVQVFNGESSAVRIWVGFVVNYAIYLSHLHFSSNNQKVWSHNQVNVLSVYADYTANETMKNTDHGSITMTSCTFINNTANVLAYFGGFVSATVQDCTFMGNKIVPSLFAFAALNVETGRYSYIRININQNNFTDNEGGPVLAINPNVYSNEFYFYVEVVCFDLLIRNNTLHSKRYFPIGLLMIDIVYRYTVVIQHVRMIANHIGGVGGGLYFRKNIKDAFIYEQVSIADFVFENNTVSSSHGAAIWISDSVSRLYNKFSYLDNVYRIINSTFKNTIGGRSIVYSYNPILLDGNCTFVNNTGTTIYIIEQSLHIKGTVIFDSNISEDGGAVYLSKSSIVTFMNQSTVKFVNNAATRYGGAIFSDIISCATISIIDGTVMQAIEFSRNRAILAGDSIYYSLPQSCNHALPNFTLNKNLLTTSPDKLVLEPPATIASNSIYTIQDVMLGQQVSIPVCLQDFNGNVTGTGSFRVSVSDSEYFINSRDLITVGCHDSNGIFNLQFSGNNEPKENVVATVKLTSFYDHTFDWRPITVKLLVNLTRCHLGFDFDPKEKKCVCYSKNNVVSCSDSTSEIKKGYWFGTVNNKSTVTACPLNYCYYAGCKLETGICLLHHQSSATQPCRTHRHGAACGICDNGYTLSYDSTECINTEHCTIGQAILVTTISCLFWIATFVTIFAIMYFKLIIGYFYAITFYYSIIDILFGEIIEYFSGFTNMVMTISGIAKLTPQFLGKLCFVRGLSGIDQQFIHYVHPLAVLSILLAISIATRYSVKLTSLVSRGGIINVICFILLLSYTSITSTSLLLMRPLRFTGIDQVYTYLSPDIKYFHGRHAVYAAIAIVCELAIVIGLPLLLLLQPFLNHKINFIKVMPLLDQFQSCYKNKFRWFASYYMICRQIIIAIVISNVGNYFTVLYILFMACLIMALIHITVKPYKSSKLNTFDNFVLLIILCIIVLQISGHTNSFSSQTTTVMAFILVLLPLTVYLIAVLVHIFQTKKLKSLFFKSTSDIEIQDILQNTDNSCPRDSLESLIFDDNYIDQV